MIRWPRSFHARLHLLAPANQRQALTRVRVFAMRRGLAGWNPYPPRRKR